MNSIYQNSQPFQQVHIGYRVPFYFGSLRDGVRVEFECKYPKKFVNLSKRIAPINISHVM